MKRAAVIAANAEAAARARATDEAHAAHDGRLDSALVALVNVYAVLVEVRDLLATSK
jgi:hypothetical protein